MKPIRLLLIASLAAATSFAEPTPPTPAPQRAAAERFGVLIAKAFNDRSQTMVAELVDMQALSNRAADFAGLTGRTREQFVREMQAVGTSQLAAGYFAALDDNKGHVRFMRATRQFPPRSLLRVDLGGQGSQYIEFVVATNGEGRTRAIDWWQASTGELASTTMGGLARQGAERDPSPLMQLLGFKNDDPTTVQFDKVREYQRAGKYAEALAAIKEIPEPVASTRAVLTLRASFAAFARRADEYDLALEKLDRLHGNDPATSFILIDYHLKHQDWPQALAAIDTLEKRVGKDGVTLLMRASTFRRAGDVPHALASAEESVELEPDRLDSQDLRATLLVDSGRFADAVAAYQHIETQFGIRLTRDAFAAEPTFAAFLQSAAFRGWLPK